MPQETGDEPRGGEFLRWKHIAAVAPHLFRVWTGQPEIAWAKQSWKALWKAGLTRYQDDLQRHRVLLRLMVLAVLYQEFCEQAWDEAAAPRLADWGYDLKLNAFRIGQLAGADCSNECECEAGELVRLALPDLVNAERDRVIDALLAFHGSPSALFVAFWASTDFATAGKKPPPAALGRILNDVTAEKMQAFQWVTEGMPMVVDLD